jgi:hypothetical protein
MSIHLSLDFKQQHNLRYTILGADVSDDWDDLASNVLAMCLDNLLKLLLGTTNDINLGTVDSQSLGDHETDTRATTSNEGDLVLDIKDLAHLKLGVVGRSHVCVASLLLLKLVGELLRAFRFFNAIWKYCEWRVECLRL